MSASISDTVSVLHRLSSQFVPEIIHGRDSELETLRNHLIRMEKTSLCVALVGVPGSGKSTLIDAAMHIVQPSVTVVRVDGRISSAAGVYSAVARDLAPAVVSTAVEGARTEMLQRIASCVRQATDVVEAGTARPAPTPAPAAGAGRRGRTGASTSHPSASKPALMIILDHADDLISTSGFLYTIADAAHSAIVSLVLVLDSPVSLASIEKRTMSRLHPLALYLPPLAPEIIRSIITDRLDTTQFPIPLPAGPCAPGRALALARQALVPAPAPAPDRPQLALLGAILLAGAPYAATTWAQVARALPDAGAEFMFDLRLPSQALLLVLSGLVGLGAVVVQSGSLGSVEGLVVRVPWSTKKLRGVFAEAGHGSFRWEDRTY